MSENIFKRLREERNRLGKTQEEFALIAGVTRVPYTVWEKGGGASPPAQSLALLAKAGADVLYILTGERSRPVAAVDLLPADERILLDNYRNSPPEARAALKATSAAFAGARTSRKAA